MPIPNIPDIKPKIDIKTDDSINLLLESIANAEMSLSNLMDAEMKKILFVLKAFEKDEANLKDVIEINESVNKTIKSMMKFQMLLQFKLESVQSFIPLTTTSTTSTSATTMKCLKHRCGIMGKRKDVFYHVGDYCNSLCIKVNAFDINIAHPSVKQPNRIKIKRYYRKLLKRQKKS